MKLREQIDHELREMHPDEKILQDILKDPEKKKLPGFRLLLCAAFLGCLLVLPVSAHMFGMIRETTRITDENRALLDQPDTAVCETLPTEAEMPEEPKLLMDDLEKVSDATDGIIQEIEDGAFLPDTVTVITLSPGEDRDTWMIPELLTANGFTTIFTKADGSGWTLLKGETLRIDYQAGGAKTGSAVQMEIGSIEDHVFRQGILLHASDFSYTLTAPADGTYYLYCINSSSGKIDIREGTIRKTTAE